MAAADANAAAKDAAPGFSSLPPFALERFFSRHEFTARHLLCCSDCEPWTVRDLLLRANNGDDNAGGDNGAAAGNALLDVRLGYTEMRGDPSLRAAIARRVYASVSPPLDPARDILTMAPQEGIFLATQALALKPGELVVVTKPVYQSLYANAESCGACVLAWRPRVAAADASASASGQGSGRLAFDVRDLEQLLSPVIDGLPADGGAIPLLRAVYVNFVCHNPTGFLATDDLWTRLTELLSAANAAQRRRAEARGEAAPPPIVLFSDEMYAHMEPWRDGGEGQGAPAPKPPRVTTALDLCIDDGQTKEGGVATVVLCGLSKSWGCPGLRTGWLASRNAAHLIDRAAQLKDYVTICSAGPCEHLALLAVEQTRALTRAARARVAHNAVLASDFFGGRWRRLFEWPGAPDAGPICFPRARRALLGAAGCADIAELCEKLAKEAGVLLLPATVYNDDKFGGGSGQLEARFRLGLGRAGFAEGLAALDAWLVGVAGEPPES